MNGQRGVSLVLLLVLLLSIGPGSALSWGEGRSDVLLPTGHGRRPSEETAALGRLGPAAPPAEVMRSTAAEGAGTLPAGDVPADWWSAVQDSIRSSEYHITWQKASYLPGLQTAYQAPNRAHNLRTYFTPEGAVLIPRVWSEGQTAPSWQLGLTLQGAGPADELLADANRIEYRREGLAEWYVNGEDGLEWGAEIQNSNFEIRIALHTSLAPVLVDNQTVEFHDAAGKAVLRYGDISATDTAGREVPVHLELLPAPTDQPSPSFTHYVLLITPEAASYPLTIHAHITSPAAFQSVPLGLSPTPNWAAEGNQAAAQFGFAVNTAGDVNRDGYSDVIVGAPYFDNGQAGEGQAYVYYGSAAGLELVPAWITESDQVSATLGIAVGLAGDVNGDGYGDVIIGASLYDVISGMNTLTDTGRAYVYHGSPAGPSPTPDWTAAGSETEAWFATAVAAAGDVNGDGYSDVIVGAPGFGIQFDDGAAFVYHGSPAGLAPAESWAYYGALLSDAWAGAAVSTAGDVNGDGYSDVIVGAPNDLMFGAAYAFHGSPSGLNPSDDWSGMGGSSFAEYGRAVAAAGDVNGDGYADVIVGAPGGGGLPYEGQAYIYTGSPIGLIGNPTWSAGSNQAFAEFGLAVNAAGDVNGDGLADIIVGAPYYDISGTLTLTDGGRAYVFLGSIYGLPTEPDWIAEGDQAGAQMGAAMGTAGDVNGDGYSDIIVGASGYSNGQSNEGAAYLFHGSSAGLALTPGWNFAEFQGGAHLGFSIGTAGDVDGDGYADLIVGAPGYDAGQFDEGNAYIFRGLPYGLDEEPFWEVPGDQMLAAFGWSVGTAGDVNGDGYTDVVVGAPYYDNSLIDVGAAYVYYGSVTGPALSPDWTVVGGQSLALMGYAVGTAGDLNGDGYADVVVGVPSYGNGQVEEGAALVYHGSGAGLSTTPNWTAEGNLAGAGFGFAVGTAGDVDGDGYSDLVVGAPDYGNGQAGEGAAFVYHGSAFGLDPSPRWIAESDQAAAALGWSVGTAGDLNGDGFADVVAGASAYDNGQSDEGAAFAYHGSPAGLAPTPDWTAEGDQAAALFGCSVGTAGDLNGDGFADVVVGASAYDNGQTDEGAVFVYYGSPAGLAPTPDWMAEGGEDEGGFGYAVQAAGDVNGDGYGDLAVGAPYQESPQVELDEGTSSLYHGNGESGPALRPQQLRSDGSAPIAPGGMSDSATTVQLSLIARMPLGREWVKLQWQVAPLGTPFTSSGVISGTSLTWTDVLTTGLVLTQNVSGLAPGWPYAWRVRLLYHPGNRLGQAASRWLTMPWDGWAEKDLRTADGPITGLTAYNDSLTVLGNTTTLTATADPLYVAYTWAFGDGQTGRGAVLTHTYSASGVFTAVVTASNSLGSVTTSTVVLVEEPIAGLSAVNDGPTALGSPTTFTATVSAGSSPAYTWAFGDGETGSGAVAIHIYPASGVFTAVVTASNSLGSVTTSTVVLVEEPIAGLSAVNDGPTALGSPTTFTATVSAGSSPIYTWDFGDGGTGSGAVVTHTYITDGNYLAIVTASNDVSALTIMTMATVEEPIAGFTLTDSSPTVLGHPTTFTATVAAGSNVNFSWDLGWGLPRGTLEWPALPAGGPYTIVVPFVYPAAGSYAAVFTASNALGATALSSTVLVDELIAGLVLGNDSPTPLGSPTTLWAAVTGGTNVSIEWDLGDGSTAVGVPNTTHVYGEPGLYEAIVTASNSVSQISAATIIQISAAITVNPVQGGTLTFVDPWGLTTTVQFPPQALARPITLSFTPLLSPTQPLPPGMHMAAHHNFSLEAFVERLYYAYLPIVYTHWPSSTRGMAADRPTAFAPLAYSLPAASQIASVPAQVAFLKPITVTLHYSEGDLGDISDESSLRLVYWSGSDWRDAADTCIPVSGYTRDPLGNWLSVPICHLTEFGLIGD